MNGGNVIDDNFRRIAITTQLDNIGKIMENQPMINGDWREATNKVIVENLIKHIEKLLGGEAKHYTCCDRTTEHEKIVIEYNHKKK